MSYDDMQESLRKATDKALEKHFQLEEENAVSRIKSLIKEIHEIASNLEGDGYNQIFKITEQLKPVFFPDKIKEKRTLEGWININYAGDTSGLYEYKSHADIKADSHRIACVRVTGEYEVEL